ncbi:mutanase Pc12g07500 [Aspergillus lentulus]|nr:mutanase Pc12g07500 [Aspergillus lentulus]
MVFLHLLISLLCIRHVQAKAVFAHFMVTNSANYTATTWVEDMKLAQEAHIDAFALNMAFDDPVNSEALSAAFAAAESLGFKLFLPFDYAGNGPWPQDTVVGYIYQYGSANADDWIGIKAKAGCFFVPDWSFLGANLPGNPAWQMAFSAGLFGLGAMKI